MMKKYIRYIKVSVISIVSIIICISIFNYKVDSLALFGKDNYLSEAAKAITNGNLIAGLENYDDRLFQEFIVQNLNVKNDVILIGSSRSMQVRKRFFLNKKVEFFNHSVSGASLEDYISIVGLYEKLHGYLPSTIIFGVDPWIFNKNNGQKRWKTLSAYYQFEINKIYQRKDLNFKDEIDLEKWKQLINYEYTINNIAFYKLMLKNKDKAFTLVDTYEIDNYVKEQDGSLHYPNKIRNINPKKVENEAINFTKGNVYSLMNFKQLSYKDKFEDFLEYLRLKGVNVVFFLPPYNPISYDIMIKDKKYKNIVESEKYLKYLSTKYNIKLIGSFNPHKYNFLSKNFYDGMHGHEEISKRIFFSFPMPR